MNSTAKLEEFYDMAKIIATLQEEKYLHGPDEDACRELVKVMKENLTSYLGELAGATAVAHWALLGKFLHRQFGPGAEGLAQLGFQLSGAAEMAGFMAIAAVELWEESHGHARQ